MNLLQDFLFGLRLMRRSLLFSTLAIFCLTAGIGLSTFMFSISYSIVGRGLPFENADRIVTVMRSDVMRDGENISPLPVADYREIREAQKQMDRMAAVTGDTVTVGLPGLPNLMSGLYTTSELFEIMPGTPHLGRMFTEEDTQPGANYVVLLSYSIWESDFGSYPHIVGKECMAEGKPATIIGVMEKGYDFPFGNGGVWLPLIPESLEEQTGWIDTAMLLGRVAEGSSVDRVEDELGAIFQSLEEARGADDPTRFRPQVRPVMDMFIGDDLRILMWTMFGATLLVLFIACTNVSSLLSARLAARENELAVRSALGASRARIVYQILTESMLVALGGTALGLLTSWAALHLLWAQLASFRFNPPSFMEFRLEGLSVLVAILLMLFAVGVSSLLPALRASRTSLGSLLNDSGRTSSNLRVSRLGTISPILQLAFSLALLVAAGRLIYGIMVMTSVEYPFEEEGLLIGNVAIDSNSYPSDEEQVRFWEELYRNLQGLPGAEAVSLGFNLPTLFGMQGTIEMETEEYASEDDKPVVRFDVVTPGYFDMLGVSILSGRDFRSTDIRGNEPVAIINTTMAERFWPGESPLDRTFLFSNQGELEGDERRHRIIGVVPDLAMQGLFNDEDDGSGFYRPQGQSLWGDQKIFVRSSGDPEPFVVAVQKIINE